MTQRITSHLLPKARSIECRVGDLLQAATHQPISTTLVQDLMWEGMQTGFEALISLTPQNYWDYQDPLLHIWRIAENISDMALALGVLDYTGRHIITLTRQALEQIDIASQQVDAAQLDLIVTPTDEACLKRAHAATTYMASVADKVFMEALMHDVHDRHLAAVALLKAVSERYSAEMRSFTR